MIGKSMVALIRRRKSSCTRAVCMVAVSVATVLVFGRALHSQSTLPYAQHVVDITAINFNSYWKACAGHDDYEPMVSECSDWQYVGGTALDSIDTLLLMGLQREYETVRDWASGKNVTHAMPLNISDLHVEVQLFELVIRALGGLNSAHMLAPKSDKDLWRTRASQLGDAILAAFDTASGCPLSSVRLNEMEQPQQPPFLPTSEAGTLQLEMRTLSVITGDERYARVVDRCMRSMVDAIPANRVVPEAFNSRTGKFEDSRQTIGGRVDSFVEMLLKTWIAFGKKDDGLRAAFERQVELIFEELAVERKGTLILGPRQAPDSAFHGAAAENTMEHLSCFFPGVLALGALHGLGGGVYDRAPNSYMTRARALMRTCFLMSRSNKFGLAPESVHFNSDGELVPEPGLAFSLLRPEIIESLHVMHSITGESRYYRWATIMWDDLIRSAAFSGSLLTSTYGLSSNKVSRQGKLHSFVFAETLKYFYLLFKGSESGLGDDSFNYFVFNTEAHPVPIVSSPPGLTLSVRKP